MRLAYACGTSRLRSSRYCRVYLPWRSECFSTAKEGLTKPIPSQARPGENRRGKTNTEEAPSAHAHRGIVIQAAEGFSEFPRVCTCCLLGTRRSFVFQWHCSRSYIFSSLHFQYKLM